MADGSNFARMFACNVGCIDIEVDLMTVWMNLPADLTKSFIFEAGDLNTVHGTVNLIWNSRFHEYIVSKYRPVARDIELYEVVVDGGPFEATTLLDLLLTEFPTNDEGTDEIKVIASHCSTEVNQFTFKTIISLLITYNLFYL